MSKKHEEEIEEKLRELEISMKESTASNVPSRLEKSTDLAKHTTHIAPVDSRKEDDTSTVTADFMLLGGFALLLLGVFILFSHLTVTTGLAGLWNFGGGNNGSGFLILLLLVGMGFFFYDYKNKVGWLLVVCSLAALIFSMFATMHVVLMPMSLLSLIFLFLPWVLGGGLLAKGIKRHNQVHNTHKNHDR